MSTLITVEELPTLTGLPSHYLTSRRYETGDWGSDYRLGGHGLAGGSEDHWRLHMVYPRASLPDITNPDGDGTATCWLLAREYHAGNGIPRHTPGNRVIILAGPWTLATTNSTADAAAQELPDTTNIAQVKQWLARNGRAPTLR